MCKIENNYLLVIINISIKDIFVPKKDASSSVPREDMQFPSLSLVAQA